MSRVDWAGNKLCFVEFAERRAGMREQESREENRRVWSSSSLDDQT